MSDIIEQVNEARRLVEELGGEPTKSIDELKVELDRMVEESKKPGYSPENAERLAQRQLVIDSMLTARDVLTDHFLDDTQSVEAPAPATQTPEVTETPSVFVSPSESPRQALKTEAPATGTQFERFMHGASSMASQGYEGFKGLMSSAGKNISAFFAYLGTSITTLWNRWFGKKDTTTQAPAAATPTQSEPVANPEAQARYEEDPPSASPSDVLATGEIPTTSAPTEATEPAVDSESAVQAPNVTETQELTTFGPTETTITVDAQPYTIRYTGETVTVNGKSWQLIGKGIAATASFKIKSLTLNPDQSLAVTVIVTPPYVPLLSDGNPFESSDVLYPETAKNLLMHIASESKTEYTLPTVKDAKGVDRTLAFKRL